VGWLAGVLGQCKALAYLDLSANKLGAEEVRWLAGALAKRKALYHLNVDCNASGPEGPGVWMLGGGRWESAKIWLISSWATSGLVERE